MLRAIRGATTAPANSERDILDSVQELLCALLSANGLGADQLVCAFFSATPDLDAAFPARAAREAGLSGVPLFGAQELAVPGAPERCLRVMLLADEPSGAAPAKHVYLRGARALRPDLAVSQGSFAAPPVSSASVPGSYFYFSCY